MTTTAVVIINHRDFLESELISLRSLKPLIEKGIQCYFVHPRKETITNALKLIGNLSLLPLDDIWFENIHSYNKLLKQKWFYELFQQYKHILIYQSDCIITNYRLLFNWCDLPYSYVGAPWTKNYDPISKKLWMTGNGGLSLRRVGDFIKALEQSHYDFFWCKNLTLKERLYSMSIRNPEQAMKHTMPEDIFWSKFVGGHFSWFKTPDPRDALDFAIEVNPKHFFEQNNKRLPFGVHAWEKYDKVFWLEQLEKINIK